jgi:hypothetical protein
LIVKILENFVVNVFIVETKKTKLIYRKLLFLKTDFKIINEFIFLK